MSEPAVISGDEPNGNLDPRSGTEVLKFMRRSVDELQQSHDAPAPADADTVLSWRTAGSCGDRCGRTPIRCWTP